MRIGKRNEWTAERYETFCLVYGLRIFFCSRCGQQGMQYCLSGFSLVIFCDRKWEPTGCRGHLTESPLVTRFQRARSFAILGWIACWRYGGGGVACRDGCQQLQKFALPFYLICLEFIVQSEQQRDFSFIADESSSYEYWTPKGECALFIDAIEHRPSGQLLKHTPSDLNNVKSIRQPWSIA